MGKYMRKRGDSVCSYAVADGSLGARTRARARALQRQLSSKNPNHGLSSTPHSFANHSRSDASYMQLRSRIVHNSAQDCASTYCVLEKEKLPPPIRCQMQKKLMHISAKEPSLRRRSMRVSNTANSAPLPNKECIITRNRKHAATLDQADIEMTLSNHGLDSAEINPEQEFCGESQTVDDNDGGDSSKDKLAKSRERTENSRDSFIHGKDASGSSSRSRHSCPSSALPFDPANKAPSSTDINAFFEGAEQWYRRRFIDRYNFDPMKERPLQGRYEWTRM